MVDQNFLKYLVAPMEESVFLEKYFGKHFCHLEQGEKDFSDLFSWQDLDQVLQTQWIQQPRMRLVYNKTRVDEREYLTYSPNGLKKYQIYPNKIKAYLQRGAALVIDNIDQINANLKTLANSLEWRLSNFVKINAYFAYANSKGFPPHADYHDVLVLQVSGSKVWNIYGNNHFPIRDVYDYANNPLQRKAFWSQELKAGEVLYIPRGCWHDAYTEADSHSIHLTIGIYKKTAFSFLNWLTQHRLSKETLIRQDLPLELYDEQATSARANYLQDLQKSITACLSEESLQAYIAHDNAHAEAITNSQLSPTRDSIELREDDELFVLSKRAFSFEEVDETHFSLKTMKKKWTFNKALLPFFQYLDQHRQLTVREALMYFEEDRETAFYLLEKCITENLIAIRTRKSVKINL